jgi:ketosteroid isomerase-like protein
LSANARIARRMWDALSRGDADAFFEIASPELRWVVHGDNPFGGEVKGPQAVIDHFASYTDVVEDLRLEARDFYGGESGAVIHWTLFVHRGNDFLTCDYLTRLTVAGGLVVTGESVPVDPRRVDAFWRRQAQVN